MFSKVKVRSKDEINEYDEEELQKERETLYLISPTDLINYIQTSIEILMNLKVEDYLTQQRDLDKKSSKLLF